VSIHDVEQNITSGVNVYDYDNYDLATPGALEQWNLGTSCNDYPPNGVTATSITVKNKSDATVYPAWHTYVDTGITQCAFETQSSASSWMRLWFNVKPISDSIADGSTNYYLAWVRGGYPNLFSEPYTYYWEYCYWDCSDGGGGGALRAATRSARRNGSVSNANGGPRLGASAVWSLDNVESGWHYLSSDNAVFWTGVSDSLRLTITDSRSNQASTVRWIP